MGPAASHTGQAYEDLEIIRAFRQWPLVKKVTVLMREMDVLKHILIYDVYCIYCIVNTSKPPVEATADLHPTLAPPAKLRTLYPFSPGNATKSKDPRSENAVSQNCKGAPGTRNGQAKSTTATPTSG